MVAWLQAHCQILWGPEGWPRVLWCYSGMWGTVVWNSPNNVDQHQHPFFNIALKSTTHLPLDWIERDKVLWSFPQTAQKLSRVLPYLATPPKSRAGPRRIRRGRGKRRRRAWQGEEGKDGTAGVCVRVRGKLAMWGKNSVVWGEEIIILWYLAIVWKVRFMFKLINQRWWDLVFIFCDFKFIWRVWAGL